MKVSEPIAAYNVSSIQALKNRLITSIEETDNEERLQECLELLAAKPMPCCFTEEELDREIMESETGGFASEQEVKDFFDKWRG